MMGIVVVLTRKRNENNSPLRNLKRVTEKWFSEAD